MLLWGVYPILCKRFRDTDKLVDMAEEMLEQLNFVQKGQIVGIVAGTRTKSGATNFMRLHMVGDRDSDPKQRDKPKKKEEVTSSYNSHSAASPFRSGRLFSALISTSKPTSHLISFPFPWIFALFALGHID